MGQIIYVFAHAVYYALVAVQLLMFAKAFFSIFMIDEDSKIGRFLYYATEPIIYPVRWLLQKVFKVEEFVLDIPFMVTMILLVVVQAALPTIRI